MKLLVIPDCHAEPENDNERFTWLGRYIAAERPDTVGCLGDFGNMASLSSYDKGKRSFEGRRYKRDIACVIDAQQKLWKPVQDLCRSQRRYRHKIYDPDTFMLLGNHEDRISRATDDRAELFGTLDLSDLRYDDYWDRVIPFKEYLVLENTIFAHFLPNKLGRAMAGVNHARAIANAACMSIVVGHSHLRDFAEIVRPDGTRIMGIVAGCYTHPDYVDGFEKGVSHAYWKGVVMLEGFHDGTAEEVRFVNQSKIKELYA